MGDRDRANAPSFGPRRPRSGVDNSIYLGCSGQPLVEDPKKKCGCGRMLLSSYNRTGKCTLCQDEEKDRKLQKEDLSRAL